jgi:ABC-2 type transport system permease protein
LRQISLFNPMAYMIDAFRYSYIDRGDVPLGLSLGVVTALSVLAFAVALRMTAAGYKLRT